MSRRSAAAPAAPAVPVLPSLPVLCLAVSPAVLAQRAQHRADEVADVASLLMAHAAPDLDASAARAVAHRMALACLGDRHLWEDLGLPSRAALGAWMTRCFPTLVALNAQGMRWKKFLYRQLCLREDILVCRSPSCAVCPERALCFGPETPSRASGGDPASGPAAH